MDSEETALVYTLKSSRDQKIRYVGQTTTTADARYRQHMAAARKSRGKLAEWMRAEIEAGFKILMGVVNENATLNVTEQQVIAKLRSVGYDLLNRTRGGGVTVDRRYVPMSEETKAKISKAKTGQRHTEETKARIRASHAGRRAIENASIWYSTDPDFSGRRFGARTPLVR